MNQQVSKQVNSNAVASLTNGILSIGLPGIGLILGMLGIFFYMRSKRMLGQHQVVGHGMAVAGFICSIVGVVIQLLMIIAVISFYMMTSIVVG